METAGHRTPPAPARWSVRGASALELVIVASLTATLLGLSVPSLRGAAARQRLEGWARAMTADIAAGRQAAMLRRTTASVTVTATGYTVAAVDGGTLRQATLPGDITLATTCPGEMCTFNRYGVPTATGEVRLRSSLTATRYVITIEDGTGRVSFREE